MSGIPGEEWSVGYLGVVQHPGAKYLGIGIVSTDALEPDQVVALISPADKVNATDIARAKLIAAAPLMLEALRPIAERGEISAEIITRAQAAVLAATVGSFPKGGADESA